MGVGSCVRLNPIQSADLIDRVRPGTKAGCGDAYDLGCWKADPIQNASHKGKGAIGLFIVRGAKVHANHAHDAPKDKDDHDPRENLADHIEGMAYGLPAAKPG